ncbi:MAG TPA: type I glyceraldehyde-3-phosphate dehydrogenase [Dehalococcoidia bacterium]|nr:type I glyceraldehyde-3-phosphate dehydrogenase [Dehalococcoidia bacterium]
MATRIGINGFGRIGRQVFKAIKERHGSELEVVAINDLYDTKTNAHLLKYDSNYGRYPGTVEVGEGGLIVDGKPLTVFAEKEPANIPWGKVGAEIVVESTGFFTDADQARAHIHDTVKKVIISAPAKNEDVTLVLGVNAEKYDPAKHQVVSNASCTTNGLAPTVKVLVDTFGLVKGQMTTIHAYTNSQRLLDMASKDLREARAAALNIVPASTGAARALKLVIPEVDGKLDGVAYRVPTPTVSIVEVVALVGRSTSVDEVNDAMRKAAAGPMKGILAVSDEPLVSMDLKGDPHSSTVDSATTNVVAGDLVKVASWYDNEWGYSCRTADLCAFIAGKGL